MYTLDVYTRRGRATGCNPDAEHRPLPAGLAAALDPRRIGMFGWSKGATATALGVHYLPAQVIATGLVFCWTFTCNRRWTFAIDTP